jgi:hypothetical protein
VRAQGRQQLPLHPAVEAVVEALVHGRDRVTGGLAQSDAPLDLGGRGEYVAQKQ